MIFLYTALYPEAKVLIRYFNLKRQQTPVGFDVYENEDTGIRLILTGVGALAAATAVGSSLAYYRAGEGDMLVNWGSCGGAQEAGSVYRCNKLTDRATQRTYYPDMIISYDLPEAGVITESRMWKGQAGNPDGCLHDMEAAAIYAAGSYFLSPHQMHFLKVVTDQGGGLGAETFAQTMDAAGETCLAYVQHIEEYLRRRKERELLKMDERSELAIEEEFGQLCRDFHCSRTMQAAFLQCIRYWTLSGTDYRKELSHMREDGELPCRDRREGKLRFEQLKARLL